MQQTRRHSGRIHHEQRKVVKVGVAFLPQEAKDFAALNPSYTLKQRHRHEFGR
jgi:hypothetical protein